MNRLVCNFDSVTWCKGVSIFVGAVGNDDDVCVHELDVPLQIRSLAYAVSSADHSLLLDTPSSADAPSKHAPEVSPFGIFC